jgi:hypothetical protein
MPKLAKATTQHDTKTLAWFEHEILMHTPQVGILDGASLGAYAISEFAGNLAGEWKRHRVLMQDLDTKQVTTTLGELLGAVVQMAHAVGVSLESLAEGQVQRVRTAPAGARHRKTAPAEIPAKASAGGEDIPRAPRTTRSSKRTGGTAPSEPAAPRRGRASTRSQGEASLAPLTKPARSPSRIPRLAPTTKAGSSPAPKSPARAPSPSVPGRKRRAAAPATVQPMLLGGDSAVKRRKQSAVAATKRP